MGNVYFFTGFPGFISMNLVKEMIEKRYDIEKIYLLVLPEMKEKAEKEIGKLLQTLSVARNKDIFKIVIGDITKENLNIADEINERLQSTVTHVFHLAAIYDLAVPKDIAYKVNVTGTDHVNKWLKKLQKLERYIYFSTAYVSGKREGKILETELDENQTFKNHYEQTKFEAEVLVQQVMPDVPTTIIRPGVVAGHSKTGETVKFDGPYFLLNFFDKLKFLPFISYLGRGDGITNFVPIDYILNATLYLAHSPKGKGKVYHLTDPNPCKMRELYELMAIEYLGKKPVGTLPLFLARFFLSFSAMRKWLKVEKEALDYFTFHVQYDNSQAEEDLKGSGITCPKFTDVIPAIVEYYRRHKDDAEKHINIV